MKNLLPTIPGKKTEADIKIKTAQQWVPIADVKDFCAYRKDQNIIGFIRIMPLNTELLSKNELKRQIQNISEAYSGLTRSFMLFNIGRPVDLSQYIDWLVNIQKNETNFLKKRLQNKIIQHNTYLASSGGVVERRYYFITPYKNVSEKDAIQNLRDISNTFNQSDLVTGICSYDDILDLLLLFTHPTQALSESTSSDSSFAPILEF